VARGAFLFLGQRRPGVPQEQRSRWGKDGWDLAERAIAVNPNDVAGYYWAPCAWATTRWGWAW
jgi:hypothetical protein